MRVALDFDGVLARTTDFVCAVMTAGGFPCKAQDVHGWDTLQATPARTRAFHSAYEILDALPNIRAALEPYDAQMPGNLVAISHRFNVEIVSANEARAADGINAWLQRHAWAAASLPVRCIGRNAPSKATLGYDVLVDDNPTLADEVAVVRRWRTSTELYRLLLEVERAKAAGRMPGTVLLLGNTRWNGEVPDKDPFPSASKSFPLPDQ